MEYCVICKELSTNDLETVERRQKGSDGINNASKLRGDTLQTFAGQRVHQKCRQKYCTVKVILPTSRNIRLMKKKPLVQVEPCVPVKQHLFLLPAKLTGNKRGHDVFPVRTIRFSNHIKPNL